MERSIVLGVLVSLTAVACAPVASSVPKMVQQPRSEDHTVRTSSVDLGFDPKAKVRTAAEYSEYEKSLGSDFKTIEFTAADREFTDFLANRRANLFQQLGHLDQYYFVVVLVTNNGPKLKEVKIAMNRENNQITLSLPDDAISGANWASMKKSLTKITVAYRVAQFISD